MKKLILIDGNSVAFRAFYGLPLLSNQSGLHTNAIFGYARLLEKLIADEAPTHFLVAFDAGKSTFRHKQYEEYKGGRQKMPPELGEQLAPIRRLIDAYGIKRYELDEYEADDIIGTMSRKADEEGFETIIIISRFGIDFPVAEAIAGAGAKSGCSGKRKRHHFSKRQA